MTDGIKPLSPRDRVAIVVNPSGAGLVDQHTAAAAAMAPAVTPAALRYIANEFACMADDPAHRERLKGVVRTALENAADELEFSGLLLIELVRREP